MLVMYLVKIYNACIRESKLQISRTYACKTMVKQRFATSDVWMGRGASYFASRIPFFFIFKLEIMNIYAFIYIL